MTVEGEQVRFTACAFYDPWLPAGAVGSSTKQKGFPGSSVVKDLPASAEDACSIPRLGRSPREGNGNQLQYSCLGNPMDRRAWQVSVHGVAKELGMT